MSFERLIGAVKTKVKIKFIITRLKVSNKNWREIKDDNNNYRHEYDFGSNHIHTRDKLYALNWVAAAVAQSYKCNWDGFLLWWEHTITYILDSVQDDSKNVLLRALPLQAFYPTKFKSFLCENRPLKEPQPANVVHSCNSATEAHGYRPYRMFAMHQLTVNAGNNSKQNHESLPDSRGLARHVEQIKPNNTAC